MALIANIIYTEEITELAPLTKLGVEYVLRHGENHTGYYVLDYSHVEEYGYAFLGKEISERELPLQLEWIDSEFYKERKNG